MAKLFRAISSSELAAELRKVIPQLQEISAGKVMHLSILGPTTPHMGHRWGLVGIICDLHVNFDPRGGAFDQFAVKKYWSGLGRTRKKQSGYLHWRKERTEIFSKFSDVFRGEEIYSVSYF